MHSPASAFRSWTRRLDRSRWRLKLGRAGAVAIVTAVCLPALVMIMGFVADFAYASYINQTLARATDNATVGSVSQTAATAAGGYGDTAYMQNYGVNIFNANVSRLPFTGINFNLAVASDGTGGVTATGTYNFNVPTFFGRMLGINTIPVSGTAATSARPLVYVNYYILVDTSQSMGIASTAADMTKLYNLVVANRSGSGGEVGCVFGCHVIGMDQNQSNMVIIESNEALAHTNNVVLRIDAAVTAVKSIISQAQSIAATAQNIQFGLYTIQQDPTANPLLPSSLIQTVASPTTNYNALQAAASTIDLGKNVAAGTGDTNFPSELTAFNTILTTSGVIANGTGASAASPLNYFLIVTDGLTDIACGPSCHSTSAFDPSTCTQLKNKGTVGVIYTIYNPIYYPNNSTTLEGNYSSLVKNYASQIQPNLQSCASSSGFFFPANDGPDIITAMQTLFQQTQAASARITQ